MKQGICFLAVLCILITGGFGAAAQEKQIGLVAMLQGSNVRSEASADAAVIGKAEAGVYYGCFEAAEGWYRIKLSGGDMGYVSAKRCTFYNTVPAVEKDALPLLGGDTALQPGDLVTFGAYEQDNDRTNGYESIQWIVLARDDEAGRLLLLSRFALDRQHYHTSNSNATWEQSGLRKWLNGEFLQKAFTEEERKAILVSEVAAHKNTIANVTAGKDTKDQVFLLSMDEVDQYLTREDALCMPTAYAIARNAYYDMETGGCWWWLRTPGHNRMHTAYVNWLGEASAKGYGVISNKGAVRPALWVTYPAAE